MVISTAVHRAQRHADRRDCGVVRVTNVSTCGARDAIGGVGGTRDGDHDDDSGDSLAMDLVLVVVPHPAAVRLSGRGRMQESCTDCHADARFLTRHLVHRLLPRLDYAPYVTTASLGS